MLVLAIKSLPKGCVPTSTALPVLSSWGVCAYFQRHTDSFSMLFQKSLILFRAPAQPKNRPAATFVAFPGNPGPPGRVVQQLTLRSPCEGPVAQEIKPAPPGLIPKSRQFARPGCHSRAHFRDTPRPCFSDSPLLIFFNNIFMTR